MKIPFFSRTSERSRPEPLDSRFGPATGSFIPPAGLGAHGEDVPHPSVPPTILGGPQEMSGGPPAGTIGSILVASGRMSAQDAQRTLQLQLESGLPFGEAARKLGVASEQDIRFALGRQFALHSLDKGDEAISPEVVAAFDPTHEVVEHMRLLRGQIMQNELADEQTQRAVAVLGVERGVGRTFVAANLATVFAQLGHRTLLVDGDLLRPRIHELFRLPNRTGLSLILAQRAKLDVVRQIPAIPKLAVLTGGPIPPNPHDLIARPVMRALLRECAKAFDIILIDTPAATDGSSGLMAAAAAGSAFLVTRKSETRVDRAKDLVSEVSGAGARLLGAVFNRA